MTENRKANCLRTAALLLLLTFAALLIHGYHVGVEDQEVYLAAIKKNMRPELYPFNSQFFTEQMKASVFIEVMAWSVRLTHASVEWVLLVWHVAAIFLVLLGCWKVASVCFTSERARWAAVVAVTVLLTVPIAGTALYPVDQYLHPRALASGGILLALAGGLRRRWATVAGWLLFALLMHPLMALFGISLVVFATVKIPARARAGIAVAMVLPFGLFQTPSAAWKEAALARSYYFPLRWEWYEWLGLIGPMVLVWWFGRIARKHKMDALESLTSRVLLFGAFQFCVAAVMTMPPPLQALAALQPMRWLHIFYFVFLVMAGGLAGEFLLKRSVWRWVVAFVPLAAVMLYVQRDLFEYSNHVDWPGSALRNPWAKAFVWARDNTPLDARFAIDPNYMGLHAEDAYGFRALSERSLLAENQKDPGEATVFPELAPLWQEQVHAQLGIEGFSREQFEVLRSRYGVDWVVLPAKAAAPLTCPYENEAAKVCRVEETAKLER